MARETLKDFLLRRGNLSDSISYILKEPEDGLGIDPGTGEELLDLSDGLKGLIGDYVNFITRNNEYNINPGNNQAASNRRGNSLQYAENQGSNKVHVEAGTQLGANLGSYSNSKKFDSSGTNLDTLIDKNSRNFTNNDVLKDIQGRRLDTSGATRAQPLGENNDVVKAIQGVLLQNNRFANVGDANNSTFTNVPQDIENFESEENNEGSISIQNEFGVYNKNSNIVSFEDLRGIGEELIRRSVEFSYIDNEGFVKQNVDGLRANDVDNSPREKRGDFIEKDPNANSFKTFGSTYYDQADFKNIRIHKLKAAVSLIAVKNLGKIFFNDIMDLMREKDRIDLESIGKKIIRENSKVDPVVYMMGKSKELASLSIDNFIFSNVFTNTEYPLSNAIDQGFKIVFGEGEGPGEIKNSDVIRKSPGFWLAVANSVLKTFDNLMERYDATSFGEDLSTDELFLLYKGLFESNSFLKFFNVMAVIGDISLKSSGGTTDPDSNYSHHFDVDGISDNRAIPGKSRKKFGSNQNELSWSQDATPSMYMLPGNIIRAASRLNNVFYGENPVRGMFGSKLVKNTYTGIDVDGSYNRIPNEVVKIVEDNLDAEYVPFYIQDLRTNEIISFNAFLTSLSDDYNVTYNAVEGYGRLDPVQIYKGTSRSLRVEFTLYATNREDFDSMWYKINKLLTTIYPQWTPGTLVSNGSNENSKFYQPFSQVMGGTPVVRLRVGDVIKSNYSRFGLARMFGIGETNVNAVTEREDLLGDLGKGNLSFKNRDILTDVVVKAWLAVFGSPHSLITSAFNTFNEGSTIGQKVSIGATKSSLINLASKILVNGFANPLAVGEIVKQLRDPNLDVENLLLAGDNSVSSARRRIQESALINAIAGSDGISGGFKSEGVLKLRRVILKPNTNSGYYCIDDEKRYILPRSTVVRVVDLGKGLTSSSDTSDRICYRVKVVDNTVRKELFKKDLIVNHSDILPDPKNLFLTSVMGSTLFASDPGAILDIALGSLTDNTSLGLAIPSEAIDLVRYLYENEESTFMRPEANPFVRAIETTKGRGLAGVIKGLSFDWLSDFPWELDYNARAPIGCKISFNFDVIHDLPPGLDHSGYNRAPLYNVGEVMKNISGDVYSDGGRGAEINYKNEAKYASRVK